MVGPELPFDGMGNRQESEATQKRGTIQPYAPLPQHESWVGYLERKQKNCISTNSENVGTTFKLNAPGMHADVRGIRSAKTTVIIIKMRGEVLTLVVLYRNYTFAPLTYLRKGRITL